jgi:hypothetical protein
MRNRLSFFFAVAVMAIGFLAGAGTPAKAGVGPGDDRQLNTPTGWATYTGVTLSQISSLLTANNARLTDIQAETPSTFTVVMVSNTGAYASGWWWYVGETEAQVNAQLSANNARLISASAYSTSGGTRFAVVMVSNTGANAKGWWWYFGSASFIGTQLNAHHARLINLSPFPGGGYLAIMVDNTASNATGWWYYFGVNATQINTFLSNNHARLIDLSRNGNGTFNVVMYSNPNTRWYWYFNYTPSGAVAKANQLGERIIDATSYTISGTKYYAFVTTDDLNSLSDKLFAIIAPKVDSGKFGFYLKLVGGGTLASLLSASQYEPASALKVLYHAKSIHEESLGNTFDTTSITYHFNNLADPQDGNICPDNFSNTTTTNLKNADTKMMQNSDNRMTRGILERYTKTATIRYGISLGLTQTVINHNIGCPTAATHNRTTLVDLGRVYEAFQNGTVTTNATWRTQFAARMLNQSNYGGFQTAICPIVQQEATALGKSPAVATNFCNAMTWIAKGGSYQYGGSLPYTVSWDGVSLTGVPYRPGGVITPRFFIFGEYIDGTQINSANEVTSINSARSKLFPEALRPYIHAALTGW